MAVAYFIAYFPGSAWPRVIQGDAVIMFCVMFLYFVFASPSPWSIEAMRKPATATL
jgi:putative oxidoreductase